MKDGCSPLSLARLIGRGRECLNSRPPAPQQCALSLADSGGRVPAQQFIDDLSGTVDLVQVGNTRPEQHFVHADMQACFNGGSHSFRRRGEGLRQTFCPKEMRELLPDALERVGTQGKEDCSYEARLARPPSLLPGRFGLASHASPTSRCAQSPQSSWFPRFFRHRRKKLAPSGTR